MKLQNLIHILLGIVCFALSPIAHAVVPPPAGGFPNQNTADGDDTLFSLTTGTSNTAIGFSALYSNTTGYSNTATGVSALYNNVMGSKNTANGEFALTANTIGMNNTAIGSGSLSENTMGNGNTAVGSQALESNATGSRNTASGIGALEEDTVGNLNTANGYNALYYSSGSNNIGLGANGGVYLTTGSNNIDIGNGGLPSDTGKIRIGTQGVQTGTSIAGIYNVAVTGSAVVVNSTGKLGVPPSSARFKGEIKPMDKVSEAILALKPVTFHYKKEIDPESIPQFGLVAEEVEKADPDLVVRDSEGKIYSVRYDAVNAMLLNEFLKEHGKVQALEATITQLKSMVEKQQAANAQQQKHIEGLTTGLQKVSAQLEANKPAPAVVNNP